MRYYVYNDDTIEIELISQPRTLANTTIGGGGLIDKFIGIGFDLTNTDKYIYIDYQQLVAKIFNSNYGKTIIKLKPKGNYDKLLKEYETEFGKFYGNRFEISTEQLKKIIDGI